MARAVSTFCMTERDIFNCFLNRNAFAAWMLVARAVDGFRSQLKNM